MESKYIVDFKQEINKMFREKSVLTPFFSSDGNRRFFENMLSQYSPTTKEEKDNATHEVMRGTTSFSPNLNNKTTSVAMDYHCIPTSLPH